MIDLKKFRENPDIFIKWAKDKHVKLDFDKFIKLDEKVRGFKTTLEWLNNQKNVLSKDIEVKKRSWEDCQSLIDEVKNIKTQTDELQKQYDEIKAEYDEMFLAIPNPSFDDVPYWESDADNVEIEKIWNIPNFDFKPLPHWELLEKRELLDQERSAKVSGSRFYYIRNWLVRLQLALVNWAINKLYKKWFIPTMGPNLVRSEAMQATGFFPAEKNEIYTVNPGEDNLFLIWTSEVTMVSQHLDETIDAERLPLRYVWYSPCYRREAWSYGKDTKWMIRLHQFEKVEMVCFVRPEDSQKEHEFLLSIEEEVYKELWIPYRKLLICTWDLGAPAAKKYDLEAWFPGIWEYKEITSCSNTTDFQARRGMIKYKDWATKDFLHTLNWTVLSMRPIVAIVENFQTKDMKIKIPEVLRPLMWWDEYI